MAIEKTTFDFTELPIEEIVKLFQSIGLWLVQAVLYRQQPEIVDWFESEHADLVVSRIATGSYHVSFGKTIQGAIQGNVPMTIWSTQILNEIKYKLGLHPDNRIPANFWELIGERAWNDIRFGYTISHLIETELRQRTLLAIGEFDTICLSPQTFWLLLVLAKPYKASMQTPNSRGNLIQRLQGLFQRVFLQTEREKVVKKLQQEGEIQGLTPGWATLWDQWILLEALAQWGDEACSNRLKQTLRNLPLMSYQPTQPDPIHLGEEQQTSLIRISDPNWEEFMPRWFREWGQIKHSQGAKNYGNV